MTPIAITLKHLLAVGATDELLFNAVTEMGAAMQFVADAKAGVRRWSSVRDYEGMYGRGEGFVYFAAIGEPRPTHIKIGFSKNDPNLRIKGLQTGCPYPIRLLGFVIGTATQEAELHDVLRDDRVQGEWFAYSDYVESITQDVMQRETL